MLSVSHRGIELIHGDFFLVLQHDAARFVDRTQADLADGVTKLLSRLFLNKKIRTMVR